MRGTRSPGPIDTSVESLCAITDIWGYGPRARCFASPRGWVETLSNRRPNIANAGADLAFAVIAFVAGIAGAPLWGAALVAFAAALVWYWTRRVALARMDANQRAASVAVALAVLFIVLGGAYWAGLAIRGN